MKEKDMKEKDMYEKHSTGTYLVESSQDLWDIIYSICPHIEYVQRQFSPSRPDCSAARR